MTAMEVQFMTGNDVSDFFVSDSDIQKMLRINRKPTSEQHNSIIELLTLS